MVYLRFFGSEIFELLRSSKYTPSVSHSLDSSLREGAGAGCVPCNVPPRNRNVAGDFHRPYENSKTVSLYHSTDDTPSVSLSLDSSLREGAGNGCTIQPAARKPQRCGRFSSPLRNSKTVSLYHSTDDTPSVSHSLDSSLREGAGNGLIPFNRVLAEIRGWRAIFIAPTEGLRHSSGGTKVQQTPPGGSPGGWGIISQ